MSFISDNESNYLDFLKIISDKFFNFTIEDVLKKEAGDPIMSEMFKISDMLHNIYLHDRKDLFGDYDTVFYKSNEDLGNIFDNFNFYNKNGLVVASSGDHTFNVLSRGAKSVDLYDSNIMTKHYFYLRKWFIKYRRDYYIDLNSISNDSSIVSSLLDLVIPQSEDEKYELEFWKTFDSKVFNSIVYKTLITKDKDVIDNIVNCDNNLISKLDVEFPFYFGGLDTVKIGKKYDFVVTSNILEYMRNDKLKLKKTRDNLYSMLNDDGIVICSRCRTTYGDDLAKSEIDLFSEIFDYDEYNISGRTINKDNNKLFLSGCYCYKKR